MTRTHIGFALALSLSWTTVGCTEPAPTPQPNNPLQIAEHTDSAIVGSYDAGDMVVDFSSRVPSQYVGEVAITLHGKTLSVRVDAYHGDLSVDGLSVGLEVDEVAALVGFSQAIADYLGGPVADTDAMHESTLYAAAAYLGAAPAKTQLAPIEMQVLGLDKAIGYSLGDDGKKCIAFGSTRTAKFDGDDGTSAETWVVGADGGDQWNGDYSCMGRCGVGCGSYDWTQDCLEHDACSRHYYSTSGALDHNCGDEYANAADDYLAWWKRCRK